MRTLQVALAERSYPIHIGAGLLDTFPLAEQVRGNQVMIITNETIAPLYLERLTRHFAASQCDTLVLPDGEKFKNLETLESIFDALMARRHSRTTTLIALGGGVIGDMVGFAAACYQRGVDFIQVPTTLLAQVDSSVGGKVGVNLPAGKNLVGAFYQPKLVLCDLDTLGTLPSREFRAGLAEVIKYGIIYDAKLFRRLERDLPKLLAQDTATLSAVIARCCQIKAEVVGQDEKEAGLRAILNFGHTIGHGLEAISQYGKYLHGEAISIGQAVAAKISNELTGLPDAEVDRIATIFAAAGLPTEVSLNATQTKRLFAAMKLDKKVSGGEIKFVLAESIGRVKIGQSVPDAAVRRALRKS